MIRNESNTVLTTERRNLSDLTVTGSTVGEWVKSESPSTWSHPDSSKAIPKSQENIIKMGERKRPKF
jgi:hypothetical protein